MRLLYVIDSLAPGGAETSLAEMAPGLISAGIDLHIVPLGARLDLASRLEQAGAVVHMPEARRPGRVGHVRSVMDTAKAIRPQAIHTTLFEADVAGRIAAGLLGVPASTSIVSDSYGPSHYRESSTMKLHAARGLDATTARFARRFHAITRAIAHAVAPRLALPPRKIEVIPRGRDPHAFPFQPTDVRKRVRDELGFGRETAVILAIGRHEPPKGLHHLLDALPAVAASHANLALLIAGKEGRSSRELRAQATRTGIDVRFLGHRSDVANLLAAADVFCFPSEREGLGGVLIEAMATGCPVVASSIPSSREVLGRGGGLLTPVGDSVALARAIDHVLDDREATAARVANARSRYEDRFTLDRIVVQMAAFFYSVQLVDQSKGP